VRFRPPTFRALRIVNRLALRCAPIVALSLALAVTLARNRFLRRHLLRRSHYPTNPENGYGGFDWVTSTIPAQ